MIIQWVYPQTGPGGVGSDDGSSNLEFWYIAEGENYSNGDLVNSVTDRSGNVRTLSAAGGERPSFTEITAGANNRASFLFALNDELESTYQGNSNENMTFGLIQSYTNDGGLNVAIQHGGRNTMSASSAHRYFDFVGGSGHTSTATANTNWTFLYQQFANSGSPRLNYYVNNTNTDNFTHTIQNRTSNTWIGGHGSGGGTGWNGGIAEVFKFSRVLNQAERIIIANYLAAKYGITLTTNDIYDEDNSDFDFDVAGIGQASDGSRHDDSQGTGMIRILNPSTMGNNEYLIWGHNNGEAQATEVSDVPASIDARFERVWRVSEVNESGSSANVGNVDIRFDLSGLSSITVTDLRLLIDTDDQNDFDDETPIGPPTDLGGGIYQFTSVPGDATGISNNRRFTIGTINSIQTPLPVNLVNFNATADQKEKSVLLEWETASELNNDFFTVERSRKGLVWKGIAVINGSGTSNLNLNYKAIDSEPFMGQSFYRLKQTAFDGQSDYSKIKSTSLSNEVENELNISINPSYSEVLIDSQIARHIEFQIISADGQRVQEGKLMNHKIDISKLKSGIYVLSMKVDEQVYQRKLIKP